jgi:hypothetical protein
MCIDLWAIGCIFAELLSLRPIFKGEEAKMDPNAIHAQAVQQVGPPRCLSMLC